MLLSAGAGSHVRWWGRDRWQYSAGAGSLTCASFAFSIVFTYDGDGKRVKSVINGTETTYFAGAHYEVTDGVVTKYYYAGAQRIAMRKDGTLNYLLGDHLGSTSLSTDAVGNVISELRYKAWGEVRYSSGSMPTAYQYTGQYSYASDFGLLFYNARWYDPALGRFAQADTIVPIPANSQSWDRYAYSFNSPVRYTDPTGHFSDDQLKKWLGLKYIGLTLDEFKEKYGELYELLSAMHFGDELYGTSEENELQIFGNVGLDEHGVLSFGGSTLNDLIESGNTGWALSRQIGDKSLVPYNSTERPDEDFGTGKLYNIDEQDETTGWGPYIGYTAGVSLSGTLIGVGIGLLIPIPIIDEVVGGAAGFVIGTVTGLTSAPPGKMVGDNKLVTYYQDPTSNSVIYIETTIVRGNTVLQSTVQQFSPVAP